MGRGVKLYAVVVHTERTEQGDVCAVAEVVDSQCVGAWVRGCVGAWVRGCVGAWGVCMCVCMCVYARGGGLTELCNGCGINNNCSRLWMCVFQLGPSNASWRLRPLCSLPTYI